MMIRIVVLAMGAPLQAAVRKLGYAADSCRIHVIAA
jgi:hypothetical protein